MGNMTYKLFKKRGQDKFNEYEINIEELCYRGEGNSSLVVALKRDSEVIRLLKEDVNDLVSIFLLNRIF